MDLERLEDVLPRMNGFFPITGEDGGNYTELWLRGGRKVLDFRRTKTVLAEVAGLYAKDIVLVKRQAGNLLGYRKDLPLLIIPQLVLIPVKVREASFKDEGTLGYAFFHCIEGVQLAKEGKYKCRLLFNDGSGILAMNTMQKLRQKLSEAGDLIKAEKQRLYLLDGPPVAAVCDSQGCYKY